MALLSVSFPDALFTDCDTGRIGLTRGPAWAGSAKRAYSRVWSGPSSLLDDAAAGVIDWMPAHCTEARLGHARCSDGQAMNELRWYSNLLADVSAKEATETVRVSKQFGDWLSQSEAQPKDVPRLRYLSAAANSLYSGIAGGRPRYLILGN